ncbi:hypothetical protein IHE31_04030 [Mycetohabitans rhizoxinica]|uniref:hypothetical protein n=1 Tax=Mycetohabitans TaxID=2571159 RepID=UPI001F219801|nr:hypothetical protein [Mycetohabitans sp. B2]MCF7694686.1 hypothetical protein [Mycetohabitans sp. B2]
MNKYNKLLAAIVLAFTQYGCGGGDGDVSSSVTDAQGLYSGITSKNQTISALILDDGSFYALYVNPSSLGVVVGNVKASDGKLSSSDIIDYDLTNAETHKTTISATYAPKGRLDGTLSYPGTNGNSVTFTIDYDTDYEKTPTLTAIAGTYGGTSKGLNTSDPTGVSIATNGYIALDSGTCKAKGTIAPRTSGNVYSMTLNFDESPSCTYSGQMLSGIAGVDDNEVIMVARASDTSHPLLFHGTQIADLEG